MENLDELRLVVKPAVRQIVPADLASYTEVNLETGQVIAATDPAITDHRAIHASGR